MSHNELLQEIASLRIENEELKTKLSALEKQNSQASETLIDNAILSGLIQVDGKKSWVQLANNFPNDCREALNALKHDASKSRVDWDIRKWETEDPDGLLKVKSSMPLVHKRLFDSYYLKSK